MAALSIWARLTIDTCLFVSLSIGVVCVHVCDVLYVYARQGRHRSHCALIVPLVLWPCSAPSGRIISHRFASRGQNHSPVWIFHGAQTIVSLVFVEWHLPLLLPRSCLYFCLSLTIAGWLFPFRIFSYQNCRADKELLCFSRRVRPWLESIEVFDRLSLLSLGLVAPCGSNRPFAHIAIMTR